MKIRFQCIQGFRYFDRNYTFIFYRKNKLVFPKVEQNGIYIISKTRKLKISFIKTVLKKHILFKLVLLKEIVILVKTLNHLVPTVG